MQQSQLEANADYGWRENIHAWRKRDDPPTRVSFVRALGAGVVIARRPDGTEFETRSANLVARWEDVPSLAEKEERERTFVSHTVRSDRLARACALVFDVATEAIADDGIYVRSDRCTFTAKEIDCLTAAADWEPGMIAQLDGVFVTDEGETTVPMPALVLLAKHIAPSFVQRIDTVTEENLSDFRDRDYGSIVDRYLRSWNDAREWANLPPLTSWVEDEQAAARGSAESLEALLAGRIGPGNRTGSGRVWFLEPDVATGVAFLLARLAVADASVQWSLQGTEGGLVRLARLPATPSTP